MYFSRWIPACASEWKTTIIPSNRISEASQKETRAQEIDLFRLTSCCVDEQTNDTTWWCLLQRTRVKTPTLYFETYFCRWETLQGNKIAWTSHHVSGSYAWWHFIHICMKYKTLTTIVAKRKNSLMNWAFVTLAVVLQLVVFSYCGGCIDVDHYNPRECHVSGRELRFPSVKMSQASYVLSKDVCVL